MEREFAVSKQVNHKNVYKIYEFIEKAEMAGESVSCTINEHFEGKDC